MLSSAIKPLVVLNLASILVDDRGVPAIEVMSALADEIRVLTQVDNYGVVLVTGGCHEFGAYSIRSQAQPFSHEGEIDVPHEIPAVPGMSETRIYRAGFADLVRLWQSVFSDANISIETAPLNSLVSSEDIVSFKDAMRSGSVTVVVGPSCIHALGEKCDTLHQLAATIAVDLDAPLIVLTKYGGLYQENPEQGSGDENILIREVHDIEAVKEYALWSKTGRESPMSSLLNAIAQVTAKGMSAYIAPGRQHHVLINLLYPCASQPPGTRFFPCFHDVPEDRLRAMEKDWKRQVAAAQAPHDMDRLITPGLESDVIQPEFVELPAVTAESEADILARASSQTFEEYQSGQEAAIRAMQPESKQMLVPVFVSRRHQEP